MKRAVRIARNDLTDLTRDGRTLLVAALLLILLSGSILSGWLHYAEAARLREAGARTERAAWVSKGEMHPHMAAHYGAFLFKPIAPLSAIDKGVDDFVGSFVFIEAHRQNLFSGRPANDAPGTARLGELTAALTLQLLIPLVIAVMTHAMFVGEREQGTLPQVLSLGVSPSELVIGKVLGLAMLLVSFLGPATALAVTGMLLNTGTAESFTLLRFSGLCVVYLTYFTVLMAIGAVVSARSTTSRQALVVLLALWFVNGLLGPRAALDFAERRHPTPTATAFASAIEADFGRMKPFPERVATVTRTLVARYGVSDAKALPVSPIGFALAEGEEESARIYRRHVDALFDSYERQARTWGGASWLFPSIAVQQLSASLAGADVAHHRHFSRAAETYRERLVQQLNQAIATNDEIASRPGDETFYARYLRGQDLWERVPAFDYSPPSHAWALAQARGSVAPLVAWVVLTAVLTPLAMRGTRIV